MKVESKHVSQTCREFQMKHSWPCCSSENKRERQNSLGNTRQEKKKSPTKKSLSWNISKVMERTSLCFKMLIKRSHQTETSCSFTMHAGRQPDASLCRNQTPPQRCWQGNGSASTGQFIKRSDIWFLVQRKVFFYFCMHLQHSVSMAELLQEHISNNNWSWLRDNDQEQAYIYRWYQHIDVRVRSKSWK